MQPASQGGTGQCGETRASGRSQLTNYRLNVHRSVTPPTAKSVQTEASFLITAPRTFQMRTLPTGHEKLAIAPPRGEKCTARQREWDGKMDEKETN